MREQLRLFTGEAGAAHNEPRGVLFLAASGRVVRFGDLGFTAEGVVDIDPRCVGDLCDRSADSLVVGNGDPIDHNTP